MLCCVCFVVLMGLPYESPSMDVQNVTRSSKWMCVKLRSDLHALQGAQITTQTGMLKNAKKHNQVANPPGCTSRLDTQ